MGGKAFVSAPYFLHTPRLPTAIYNRLKDHFHAVLAAHYQFIATPIPAPEKTSHGDIDVLVASPLNLRRPPDLSMIQSLLGAEYRLEGSSSPTKSFAVRLSDADVRELEQSAPYIEDDGDAPFLTKPSLAISSVHVDQTGKEADASKEPGIVNNAASSSQILYVQVDFRVCCSTARFRWEVFQHGHGDLWNILGTTIRPFGLTATDTGLHIRIPEIENLNRRRALVFLTDSPAETMRLLGYSSETEAAGEKGILGEEFESWDDLYAFAARCRFFRRGIFERATDNLEELKSNDRKRMALRTGYRNFVVKWVPRMCPPVAKDGTQGPSKEEIKAQDRVIRLQVLEEALDKFDKRDEYESRVEQWRRERSVLETKQATRAERKMEAVETEEYITAWTNWLLVGC